MTKLLMFTISGILFSICLIWHGPTMGMTKELEFTTALKPVTIPPAPTFKFESDATEIMKFKPDPKNLS